MGVALIPSRVLHVTFLIVRLRVRERKKLAMAITAKDQMSKLLDQLMGQNRDGE